MIAPGIDAAVIVWSIAASSCFAIPASISRTASVLDELDVAAADD
jgi:hypothetical protein